jgi:CRP/FNR family transcriptional regulator, anaerobic regulatory protein
MPALATAIRPELNRAPTVAVSRSAAAAEGVATLERIGVVMTVGREQTLFVEGDPAECYFKVVKGAMRSCRLLADGRRHIGDFFLAGDFIGLDAVENYSFSAEAVAPTTLIRYARRKVDALAEHDPRVAKSFVEIMRASLLAAHDRMTLLGRMSAMERIASFLINLADRSKDARIELPMTRTDIGDYLGLTMETVSRAFSQLKHDGVIRQCGAHEVAIADRSALKALADAA